MGNHQWSKSPYKVSAMRSFGSFLDYNRKEQLSLVDIS